MSADGATVTFNESKKLTEVSEPKTALASLVWRMSTAARAVVPFMVLQLLTLYASLFNRCGRASGRVALLCLLLFAL